MVDVYEDNFLLNLLKFKSYGFCKCIISECDESIGSKKRYHIDIKTPKITPEDIDCITFLMCIDFAINKSIQNYQKLIECLDYYEFENEENRLQINKTIEEMHLVQQNAQPFENIELKNFKLEPATKDYFYSAIDRENELMNKKFPVSLAKCPFVRFNASPFNPSCRHPPYFEFGQ